MCERMMAQECMHEHGLNPVNKCSRTAHYQQCLSAQNLHTCKDNMLEAMRHTTCPGKAASSATAAEVHSHAPHTSASNKLNTQSVAVRCAFLAKLTLTAALVSQPWVPVPSP